MRNDILLRRSILQSDSIQYLEYIESTGTQVIVTDYYPNPKTKIVADIQLFENGNTLLGATSMNSPFGTYEEYSTFYFNHGDSNNNISNATTFWIWNNISYAAGGKIISCGPYGIDKITQRDNLTISSNNFSFLGKSVALNTKTTISSIPFSMFGRSTNGNFKAYNRFNMRLFSLQIYEDDVLVRDYIPVRIGNVGYMYDLVSKKLLGNSGTGEFILGPDLPDFKQLTKI